MKRVARINLGMARLALLLIAVACLVAFAVVAAAHARDMSAGTCLH